MEAVREKLTVHNMPDEDRKRYKKFLDDLHWEASVAQTAKIEQEERVKEESEKANKEGQKKGQIEGQIEGQKKRNIEIAIKCIKRGDTNEDIMEITDLTSAVIDELRKEIEEGKA